MVSQFAYCSNRDSGRERFSGKRERRRNGGLTLASRGYPRSHRAPSAPIACWPVRRTVSISCDLPLAYRRSEPIQPGCVTAGSARNTQASAPSTRAVFDSELIPYLDLHLFAECLGKG